MPEDESKNGSGKKQDLRVVDVEKVEEKEDLVEELSACFDDLCDADADAVKEEAAAEIDSGAAEPEEPEPNPSPPEEGPHGAKSLVRLALGRID